jgi:2-succinyl-5-enolpyruvyl-6-hydroxy-3-cyclohexene-1-carboxylate synthase
MLDARSPTPGPIHVNARARKPLEPAAPETETERETRALVDAILARGTTRASPARSEPDPDAVRTLAGELGRSERGVIVVGPLPRGDDRTASSIFGLSRRLGMPVYAESTSQLRFGASDAPQADAFDWLLRSPVFLRALAPDLVLRFGSTPTSTALERLFAEQNGPLPALHVATEHGYSDATSSARTLIRGAPGRLAELLSESLGEAPPLPAQARYAEQVATANAAAWEAVARVLERSAGVPGTSEPRAVRAVVEAAPPDSILVLGNSLPVREADAFVTARPRRLHVASQRGANGIDGLIAGAAGVAVASSRPTLLLVGDVSFLHDLGGLAALRLVKGPLAVVVIDNDGGRIFYELPVARHFVAHPERAALFLTPPRLAIEHAASLFGLTYVSPKSIPELVSATESALERAGATIVHVPVIAQSARLTARDVEAEIDLRLGELAPSSGS